MIDHLTELGVPPNVQVFFALEEPVFNYGDDSEYFTPSTHFVPATKNLWMAGDLLAKQVIITYSAMEAVAFLTLNQSEYQNLNDLLFLAIGVRTSSGQLNWIRSNLRRREITLVFGSDLIGRLTDIKIATAIRNKQIRLNFQNGGVIAWLKEKAISFEEDKLSLSAFEKAFGIRTKIRTCKPLKHFTFLDQLKYDTPR